MLFGHNGGAPSDIQSEQVAECDRCARVSMLERLASAPRLPPHLLQHGFTQSESIKFALLRALDDFLRDGLVERDRGFD